jgi:hypothetical protein
MWISCEANIRSRSWIHPCKGSAGEVLVMRPICMGSIWIECGPQEHSKD